MRMMEIILPIIVLSSLGILFGLGLAFASKKFCVAEDPRLTGIIKCLPGANCGACGKPGCIGFAESLIQGEASVNSCVATEDEERREISKILGVALKEKIKTAAVLHCGGGRKVKGRFIYDGIKTCAASNLIMGGHKACLYGCLGFGDCSRVCPFGAITMGEEELPVVDENKCTACGKCVAICPKNLFSLIAADKPYYTNCSSLDLGKKVMSVCKVGCIACRKCANSCPHKAIEIKNNLAVFDYSKCKNAGVCFTVCPTKAIAKREK